jgi:hypothetical protein
MLQTPLKSAFLGSYSDLAIPKTTIPRTNAYARQLFEYTEQLFAESKALLKPAELVETLSDYYLLQADTLSLRQPLLESPSTIVTLRGYRITALLDDQGAPLFNFEPENRVYALDLKVSEGPFRARFSASFGCNAFNDVGEKLGISNSSEIELFPSLLQQLRGARE